MVNANIDIYETPYEESVSYFKNLKNLEKIRRTKVLDKLPLDSKKSVTVSVVNYSKNAKSSNMWCYYCDKNNHNKAFCRAIAKFKYQKSACFEAKSGYRKKSLGLLLEEVNTIKKEIQT
jgi:hypothetical protein